MTTHLTPRRRPEHAVGGRLPDWHSTFSANADVVSGTVFARGELDLFTAELLRGTVDVLRSAGKLDVRIDLHGLRHIDPAGVSLLSRVWLDLNHRGGTLLLLNARPTVRRLLERAGLPVAATTQDA